MTSEKSFSKEFSQQFTDHACPKCGSHRIRRCRKNTWEKVIERIVTLKAYHCGHCKHRFNVLDKR